jgi:hypothetical protein
MFTHSSIDYRVLPKGCSSPSGTLKLSFHHRISTMARQERRKTEENIWPGAKGAEPNFYATSRTQSLGPAVRDANPIPVMAISRDSRPGRFASGHLSTARRFGSTDDGLQSAVVDRAAETAGGHYGDADVEEPSWVLGSKCTA